MAVKILKSIVFYLIIVSKTYNYVENIYCKNLINQQYIT